MRRPAALVVGVGVITLLIGASFSMMHTRTMTSTVSGNTEATGTFSISSPAFTNGAPIPSRFTCDRENVNPPLVIEGVPDGAKSLVLIMDDPDIPKKFKPDGVFDHWILYNIPPETREIMEGDSVGTPGANGMGKSEYTGPCPPTHDEPKEHRYFFKLYALDIVPDLAPGAPKPAVERALEGHVLEKTELMGRYQRHEN